MSNMYDLVKDATEDAIIMESGEISGFFDGLVNAAKGLLGGDVPVNPADLAQKAAHAIEALTNAPPGSIERSAALDKVKELAENKKKMEAAEALKVATFKRLSERATAMTLAKGNINATPLGALSAIAASLKLTDPHSLQQREMRDFLGAWTKSEADFIARTWGTDLARQLIEKGAPPQLAADFQEWIAKTSPDQFLATPKMSGTAIMKRVLVQQLPKPQVSRMATARKAELNRNAAAAMPFFAASARARGPAPRANPAFAPSGMASPSVPTMGPINVFAPSSAVPTPAPRIPALTRLPMPNFVGKPGVIKPMGASAPAVPAVPMVPAFAPQYPAQPPYYPDGSGGGGGGGGDSGSGYGTGGDYQDPNAYAYANQVPEQYAAGPDTDWAPNDGYPYPDDLPSDAYYGGDGYSGQNEVVEEYTGDYDGGYTNLDPYGYEVVPEVGCACYRPKVAGYVSSVDRDGELSSNSIYR